MKQNTHVPVSIKIRVEGKSSDRFNAEIARVVEDAGADLLTVHGRHWNEHYETPCQHEQIQFFVDTLKIPVIGNGDIACIDSLKKMFDTGCAGVMIGRAGVGQPWLIKKLVTEMRGEVFTPPTLQEIRDAFLTHVIELAHLLDNESLAIMQARKFARYYARTLPTRITFVEAVNTCETLSMLQAVCQTHF